MSDKLPHSEVLPIEGTLRPEENGHSEDVSESDAELDEILAKLKQIENLGRVADRDVSIAPGSYGDYEGLEMPASDEPRLELGEMTPEKARLIASEIVNGAHRIHLGLHDRKANEPRGIADIEPASPLLLAGKLLAAIDHMQTSEERKRDQYRHADEVVSMLGLSWRRHFADFGEDFGTEALDELRFLGYIHNISKGIGDNLVVKEVLEALELPKTDRGAPHAVLIAQAHKYFTQVPEPEELSDTYNQDINKGILLGGIWFILPKFACVQDMLWLEDNSPLKSHGHKTDAIDQRVYAKKLLSDAAADLGIDDPLIFGLLPHIMETLKPSDIEYARIFQKSNFELWDDARDVQEKIIARINE